MSVVRCPECGEIVDAGPAPYCWGCGRPLSEMDTDDELRLPPVLREARRDAGRGSAVLTALGVIVLGGFVTTSWGWPAGLVAIVVVAAFAKSAFHQRPAGARGAGGVLGAILRVLAIMAIGAVVLIGGAFVFLYIVCLATG